MNSSAQIVYNTILNDEILEWIYLIDNSDEWRRRIIIQDLVMLALQHSYDRIHHAEIFLQKLRDLRREILRRQEDCNEHFQ